MSNPASILFYTTSDYGQANVVLATIHALLMGGVDFDIHVASWPALEPRLQSLVENLEAERSDVSDQVKPVKFHNLASAKGLTEYLEKRKARKRADVPHPPGLKGAERIELLTTMSLSIWDPEYHLSLFDWSVELTTRIQPSLVVLDPFLLPIHDMARYLKIKYAVLSPCSLAEGLIMQQPWLARFWQYPAFASGHKYPLPWGQIWNNIRCYWITKRCISSPRVQQLNHERFARNITGSLGSFTPWVKDIPHICPSLPDIDLPMNIPANVYHCGPILLPSPPIHTSDPALLDWLKQRPTVLMAFGTHYEAYAETIRQQTLGLRVLLDARKDIQVLWKLKVEQSSGKIGEEFAHSILAEEIRDGRVKIENWLKADPISILMSKHVICSVHHGGANSYFEAVWAGVPQIVLPAWYDTFDYATKAEYLGIGVYGNRHASDNYEVNMEEYRPPALVEAEEFGKALLKCVGKTKEDAEAEQMKRCAEKLGKVCHSSGGRFDSARIITELCTKQG